MRAAIIARESRADRAMTRCEKLDHIWTTTANQLRAYADHRFPVDFRGRPTICVFCADDGQVWKLLDDLAEVEIGARLPVQLGHAEQRTAT